MSESNATIIGAVVGAIIGVCGSLAALLLMHSRERRELKDRSMDDLIAELEQNKRYQVTSHYVDLEDDSYKRFRERGFFYTLSTDLQSTLQELYASIHEKNGLIAYYNSVGVAGLSAQTPTLGPNFQSIWDRAEAKRLTDILNIIKPIDEKIASLIDEILPKLRILLKNPSQ
jgi:gas vesicle protein